MSMKDVSDGYHTFGELYHHRTILFAALCNTLYAHVEMPSEFSPYKSWLHEDGTMFDGMFLACVHTNEGWYSYHCEKEYWGLFEIPSKENALHWDGHLPKDVDRLLNILEE